MEILKNLQYQKILKEEDFTIRVTDIYSGWMDIFICTPEKTYAYTVSYLSDALVHILDQTLTLIQEKPIHLRLDWFWKDYSYILHNLEGETIVWLLNYTKELMTILSWKNIDTELLEDLYVYKFDSKIYAANEFEPVPDLTNDLVFALQLSPKLFGQILFNMFKEIENDFTFEEYKDRWGYSFPTEKLKQLQDSLTSL